MLQQLAQRGDPISKGFWKFERMNVYIRTKISQQRVDVFCSIFCETPIEFTSNRFNGAVTTPLLNVFTSTAWCQKGQALSEIWPIWCRVDQVFKLTKFYQMPGSLDGRRPKVSVGKSGKLVEWQILLAFSHFCILYFRCHKMCFASFRQLADWMGLSTFIRWFECAWMPLSTIVGIGPLLSMVPCWNL